MPKDGSSGHGQFCYTVLDVCDKAQQDVILKPVFRNKHKKTKMYLADQNWNPGQNQNNKIRNVISPFTLAHFNVLDYNYM